MHTPVPESVMDLYQQAFLSENTGQENVAGINTHVSAIVQKMGSFASPTAQQNLMKTIEDVVYRQYLATFKGKNIHEADVLFPKIRTARDQHAIEGTGRKAVFALIKKLHELRGCTAKLEAPYSFLQDIAEILNIFENQYSEGRWWQTFEICTICHKSSREYVFCGGSVDWRYHSRKPRSKRCRCLSSATSHGANKGRC